MERIIICICTYQRPQGLHDLLGSLSRQRFHRLSDRQVSLLVIDNSADGSASRLCRGFAKTSRLTLNYVHEPKKGLVHARNMALTAASLAGATHIAFIDDDELAPPGWLEALYMRLAETGAAAVVGPVFPVFAECPPVWLPTEGYANRPRADGGFALEGHTCNALLDIREMGVRNLRFDIRFNETGGEDTMYFKTLRENGKRIAWAENARLYERVPEHRMKAEWLFRRWYRTGNVETRLSGGSLARWIGRAGFLGKGLARIGLGAGRVLYAAAAYSWRDRARVTASCYTFCRGAGFLSAALGRSYREYARADYR
ncbi:MAG: glycosyltransferase family 2 protein [Alphaproteobacteria bacterium]